MTFHWLQYFTFNILLLILITTKEGCNSQINPGLFGTFENIFQDLNYVPYNLNIPDTKIFLKEYDFIIIGSGSGGSVMANRLTEIQNFNVLLLEVGNQESFLSDVPLAAALTQTKPIRYNWGYRTEKTLNACRGLQYGVCNWPKGRALGGSSVINFLLYSRGNRLDYDEWSQLGNVGWSYIEILKYFKKSENIGISSLKSSVYHGQSGPLDVQHSPYQTKLLGAFLKAADEFGYNVTDPNGQIELGFSQVQATMRNGRRCSAAKSFLNPIIKRKNLHISMKSWVTRILIDPLTKTAFGVEFVKNKERFVVRANKEIILAAGAIGSPQLLMLSGIGPKKHLKKMGINVIQDLKVGYNLQDHVSLSGLTFLINQSISLIDINLLTPWDTFNYIVRRRGPYTLPGGAEGLAFIKTQNSTTGPNLPDIEIVMGAGALNGDIAGTARDLVGMTEEFFQTVYKDIIGKHAFALVPVLLKPKSRGRISLKSSNPFAWPRMEPNYLQHPDDMKTLIEGIKIALRLGESESFKKFGTRFHTTPYLGCEHLKFRSDEYWECCIRQIGSSLQHQVGTCKMGIDSNSVVNPQLQVYGVNNLRVVDASIIPTIPSAHTNAVVFMIGEKAADMVKEFWNRGGQ